MSKEQIRLVASDMDGTLLDGQGGLDSRFFEVYEQLHRLGIHFAAASGRQMYSLREMFAPVASEMIFIAENGSYVMAGHDELLVDAMPGEDVDGLIRHIRTIDDTYIVLAGKRSAYVEHKEAGFVEGVRRYYRQCEVVDDLTQVSGDELLKIAIYDMRGAAENSYPQLCRLPGEFQMTLSGKNWMDISRKGADKGRAMQMIQSRLGISPEETMAFGDHMNDLGLLDAARHSYAMANAVAEVKAVARYEAARHDDRGVMKVLEELVARGGRR